MLRVATALLLLSASAVLIFAHARSVALMRRDGVSAAALLPSLEQRLSLLQAQEDAMRDRQSRRSAATRELFAAYVVPAGEELDRLLASIDVFLADAQRQGIVRDTAVHVEESSSQHDVDYPAVALRIEATVTPDGLQALHTFVDVSGRLTVFDLLGGDDAEQLSILAMNAQPRTLIALEEFFSMDALAYAADPAAAERRLGFVTADMQIRDTLLSALARPSVQHRIELLRHLRGALVSAGAWPLRALLLSGEEREMRADGSIRVRLRIDAPYRPTLLQNP